MYWIYVHLLPLRILLSHCYDLLFLSLPWNLILQFSSVQFSRSVCPTVCDPMNRSTPGLPVHHQLPEFTQTHVHRIGDAIQPSHPLSSPFPPAPNPSQHQSLFQWVNSSSNFHLVERSPEPAIAQGTKGKKSTHGIKQNGKRTTSTLMTLKNRHKWLAMKPK